jgi:glyoxylase-like metal-dependent hydrolase (beta-lactamase superfamily II)
LCIFQKTWHLFFVAAFDSRQKNNWPAGVYPVRGMLSVPHVLADAEGVVLIDTGFPGDGRRIQRVMERIGAGARDVRAILLTHGHIDHAGSVAALKDWCGAPVYAHPLEQAHIDGRYPYRGIARITGVAEALGRAVTSYRPVKIDVEIHEGDPLPFWGGLRVVHLPGHTMGHCGFHSAKHDVLFSGDLWVRFWMLTQTSPRIFSDDLSLVPASMRKARAVGARWVLPGHYSLPYTTNAMRLRQRFEDLCESMERRARPKVV